MDATLATSSSKHSPCHGPRQCDTCMACCVCLPIPAGEIGPGAKPAGVRCLHRDDAGCRIYSRRPKLCVDFRCAWLCDWSWPLSWRPDHSGVMCLREKIDCDTPAALVIELRPDALGEPRVQDIIAELQRSTAVVATIDTRGCRQRVLGEHPTRESFK